jgi:hypothetical protein
VKNCAAQRANDDEREKSLSRWSGKVAVPGALKRGGMAGCGGENHA